MASGVLRSPSIRAEPHSRQIQADHEMKGRISQALEICQANPSDLKPGHVAELAYRFGGLASWWLQPSLVDRVEKELGLCLTKHRLPAGHGSCWIVFAQQL